MIQVGQSATATVTVTESNIAKTMKSGSLEVFATPAMCALMEEAAQAAVQPELNDGEGTASPYRLAMMLHPLWVLQLQPLLQ